MKKICFNRINKIGQIYFGNIRERIIDIQKKSWILQTSSFMREFKRKTSETILNNLYEIIQ